MGESNAEWLVGKRGFVSDLFLPHMFERPSLFYDLLYPTVT